MADYLRPLVCIDFFGLPGSGKSILSHLVAKELVSEGYDVDEVSYNMDRNTNSFLRSIKKILSFPFLLLCFPKVMCRIGRVIRYNGISPYCSLFYRHIINLSYKILSYKGKRSLIIFDEGICQAVLSLSYNNAYFKGDSYQQIIDCIGEERKMISVLVKASPETALKRIRKRDDGQSRLDYLSDDAALERLIKMVEVCDSLPQSIVIDNEDLEPGHYQVHIIANFIKQQLEMCLFNGKK